MASLMSSMLPKVGISLLSTLKKPQKPAGSAIEKGQQEFGAIASNLAHAQERRASTRTPEPDLLRMYYVVKGAVQPEPRFQGCFEDARALWQDYMSGKKKWSDIVEEAHRREQNGRAALMRKWQIRPAEYHPKVNEDVVIRTGTDPMAPVGRGEFSDEDLTANTLKAWQQLEEAARQSNLKIQRDEQAGFFFIPELNTLVWKPKEPISPTDKPHYLSYIKTISTHPEVVDPASANPIFSMEYVLAMINKGQQGLCEPVEKWGKDSYQRYETLIQLAKSTHHALEKTELAEKHPHYSQRWWDLCKMRKSPEELGLFKPGDSEQSILNALRREQTRMQELMSQAFSKARRELDNQLQDFTQFSENTAMGKGPVTFEAKVLDMYKNPADTYQRLCKIKLQLDMLNASQHHAPFIHHLFNDSSNVRRKSFEDYQNSLKEKLESMPGAHDPIPLMADAVL